MASAPAYDPVSRAAYARTSSNGSGLRFCGIKLEPVDARVAKPNVTVCRRRPGDQLFGDTRRINDGADACVSEIERRISVSDCVQRVARRRIKTERACRAASVERQARTGERGAAERAVPARLHIYGSEAPRRQYERLAPRCEHEGEQHRLCRLTMRARGKNRLRVELDARARNDQLRRRSRASSRAAEPRGRGRRARVSSRLDRYGCVRRVAIRRPVRRARERGHRLRRECPPRRARAHRMRTHRRRSRFRLSQRGAQRLGHGGRHDRSAFERLDVRERARNVKRRKIPDPLQARIRRRSGLDRRPPVKRPPHCSALMSRRLPRPAAPVTRA